MSGSSRQAWRRQLKGDTSMKKCSFIGRIIAIALVLIMIVGVLGSLPALRREAEASPATGFEIEFSRTFGGIGDDNGRAVQQTADGGYILAGDADSYGAGSYDALLIKTDANGSEVWQKTFGGTGEERIRAVQQTSDGGYVISGRTYSYGAGSSDVWLLKTDADGNKVWDKTFGSTAMEDALSHSATSDGGCIIVGKVMPGGLDSSDAWVIKTDADGNQEWAKSYGGSREDAGWSIQQTSDGGYILAGLTLSYGAGNYDVWVIKTDASGDPVWNKVFGGSGDDRGFSIRQTSDGGYVVLGVTTSYGAGSYDFWLIKTDADGNKQWDKTYGGATNDHGRCVVQATDGGYILLGFTESYGVGGFDLWLIKTDDNGNELWSKTYGGSGEDGAGSAYATSDGGYVISGYTNSYGAGSYDFWLLKLGHGDASSKVRVLLPWIVLAVILAGGTGWYILRRRRFKARN
jgi:hypothetical protein